MEIKNIKGFPNKGDAKILFKQTKKIPIDPEKFHIKEGENEKITINQLFDLGFVFMFNKDDHGVEQLDKLMNNSTLKLKLQVK